jgi:hypothetical protein
VKTVNTSDWPFERLEPYGPAITSAMGKLADKFPDDCTLESLANECIEGAQQLWLILDDDDSFVSFCMTNTRTVDATGKKIVTLTNMAGERWAECADAMVAAIHPWCDEIGADLTATIGSRAWLRALKKFGYYEYAVILRREVSPRSRAAPQG